MGGPTGGLTNHQTIILIDELPQDLAIKPGMTAEVDILIGTYEQIVAVPVGALAEQFGQSYVYVKEGRNFAKRRVKTDRSTHSFVEISDGLSPGEVVALDAYQRSIEDYADDALDTEDGDNGELQPAVGVVGT